MADILKTKIRLVPFQAHHLSDASRLSQQAGWPHTADDWALILTASRGVAAMVDDQLVGTALCADFGKVVTLNMIIVDATMRGQGLGRRLMGAVIDIAGPREMRLIATADGLPLYEKLGFRVTGQIVQHQSIALANVPECRVTIGGAADLDRCAAMDLAANGTHRHALLGRIAAHGTVLLCGDGFALVRPFGHGHVIGPVVARRRAEARALISAAATRCAGAFTRIDLPASHGLSDHAAACGLTLAGGGTAMVRNPLPADAGDTTTFALVSQALG